MVRLPAGTQYEVLRKNPILGRGEPFYELDTGGVKVGNGTDRYIDLPYAGIVWERGPKGEQGDEGPAGRGILSISADGDSLSFAMTDATSYDVVVPTLVAADQDARAAQAALMAAETARDDAEEAARQAMEVVGSGVPNASPTIKGGIKLTGDLGGTWDNPTVPRLDDKADREYGEVLAVYETGDFLTLNLSTPGVYRIRSGAGNVTNMPSTNDLWWNVFVVYDNETASRLYFATTTSSASLYTRVKYTNTWGGWFNLTAPYSAMSVSEGKGGTATTSRAVRADYLKQIIQAHVTGSESTPTSEMGRTLVTAASAQAVLDAIGAEGLAQKGQPNGYASLDTGGKVPANQLPSYVDDVLEYASQAAFPATGETGKIYVDTSTDRQFRWSGTAYREISKAPVTSVAGKEGAVTLVAQDISDATTTGKGLLTATNAAAARFGIGAGTSNLVIGTTADTAMAGNRIQRVTSLPAGGGELGVLYCIPKV